MHELAIAQSIFEVISEQAAAHQAVHVRSVSLRVGEAHGVVLDSLTYCFAMLTDLEPVLSGARLDVEMVPHRARCQNCRSEFVVLNFIPQCPRCQGWSNEIVSGMEFQIFEMEFEPDPAPPDQISLGI